MSGVMSSLRMRSRLINAVAAQQLGEALWKRVQPKRPARVPAAIRLIPKCLAFNNRYWGRADIVRLGRIGRS